MSIKSQLANVQAKLEILQISHAAAYEKRGAVMDQVERHTRQIDLLQELYRKQGREKEKEKPVESEPPACPLCGVMMSMEHVGNYWKCCCKANRCEFTFYGMFAYTQEKATKAAHKVIDRMRKNLGVTANK